MTLEIKIFIAYFVGHALIYVLFLRQRLRAEKSIFRLHFFSAVVASLAALIYFLEVPSEYRFAFFVAAVFFHGIYSLSSLEIWSVTEGSYSISVLEAVEKAELANTQPDLEPLHRIGEQKVAKRSQSLEGMGLAKFERDHLVLTPRGQRASFFLYSLLKLIRAN